MASVLCSDLPCTAPLACTWNPITSSEGLVNATKMRVRGPAPVKGPPAGFLGPAGAGSCPRFSTHTALSPFLRPGGPSLTTVLPKVGRKPGIGRGAGEKRERSPVFKTGAAVDPAGRVRFPSASATP
jgi:hypothetical protein